jgi:hypothetical protein
MTWFMRAPTCGVQAVTLRADVSSDFEFGLELELGLQSWDTIERNF